MELLKNSDCKGFSKNICSNVAKNCYSVVLQTISITVKEKDRNLMPFETWDLIAKNQNVTQVKIQNEDNR
jgi:hypothetical protein